MRQRRRRRVFGGGEAVGHEIGPRHGLDEMREEQDVHVEQGDEREQGEHDLVGRRVGLVCARLVRRRDLVALEHHRDGDCAVHAHEQHDHA